MWIVFELLLYPQRARVVNSLCQFPLYPSAAVQGSDGENGTEVHAGKREEGSVNHGGEQGGKGTVWERHFVGEFGAAVAAGKSKLDEQERGCRALRAKSRGMWGWPAAQTEKAACGVETGTGHKRRQERERGGREDQKRGGKRLRKWGAAAQFGEAAGTHR